MTESISAQQLVSDEKVAQLVGRYLAKRGMATEKIEPDTRLEDVGLDSLSMAEMLIQAKDELIADGTLAPGVTPVSLPDIQQVRDLTALLRDLAVRSAQQRSAK
jgi:acyl carrier protein